MRTSGCGIGIWKDVFGIIILTRTMGVGGWVGGWVWVRLRCGVVSVTPVTLDKAQLVRKIRGFFEEAFGTCSSCGLPVQRVKDIYICLIHV